MPKVLLHIDGETVEYLVDKKANLVVLAGTKQIPKLKYSCGIGKCTKCISKILSGADSLDNPNWKERKILGDKVEEGYRLTCQLTIYADIELSQENMNVPQREKISRTKIN